ncbi:MAG: Nif3-like dinuclear metal center hexameric protein [Thermoleophilia bacterium]
MLTAHVLAAVERLAPPALAEEWDNVGLIVGRHNRPARRVLVALELRDDVLLEARQGDYGVIVVHHPPIFPTVSRVTDDAPAQQLVLSAAEERIAVIAAHTNLDAAADGLNDQLADMLGMRDTAPLQPHPDHPGMGLGRVGTVDALTLEAFAARAAGTVPGPLTITGDPDLHVTRVACCTGSGASLIGAAREAQADVYVTGDLKYHDADRSEGMPMLCAPHGRVERAAMRAWFPQLERLLHREGMEARFSEVDTDPWRAV